MRETSSYLKLFTRIRFHFQTLSVSSPFYTETMKTIIKRQTFEYTIKMDRLKTQRFENVYQGLSLAALCHQEMGSFVHQTHASLTYLHKITRFLKGIVLSQIYAD